jgi:hypothetical protein
MKVKFAISLPYNMAMAAATGKKFDEKDLHKTREWLEKFEKEWRKYEGRITRKIVECSGFKWKRNYLTCFIVGNYPVAGISSPLTIRIGSIEMRVKTLIHELIHINIPRKFVNLTVKSDEPRIFTHIAVYLIYNRILKEFFPNSEKYAKQELKKETYKKAIKKSIELETLWEKSNKNIYDFMKYCLDKKLVK